MRKLNKKEIESILREETKQCLEEGMLSEEDSISYLNLINQEMIQMWDVNMYLNYWKN